MKSFVANISHEVRSPLSTATLGLNCLKDIMSSSDHFMAAEMMDLTEDCKFSCVTATHILNDLLLFDKLENKMVALDKTAVNAKDFLVDFIRPYTRQV